MAASPGRVRAELVVDAATGHVLHALAPGQAVHPASLTKLMTLEILFSALDSGELAADRSIVFSPWASSMPSTKLGVVSGDAISVGEAIAAMAVHSCNDAAVACAETLSGTENAFALRMTARARSLGLSSTTFASASGLPHPGNVSTAHDLLLLGSLVMGLHTVFWPVFGIKQWSWRGVPFENTNHLLGVFPGMDGGKTGYIRESGFCLFASAIRSGRRINAVVLGFPTAQSRDARMAELLEQAFSQSG